MASMGPRGLQDRVNNKIVELKKWMKKNDSTRNQLVSLGVVQKKEKSKFHDIQRKKKETAMRYLERKEKHVAKLISEERKKLNAGRRLLQTTKDLNSLDKKINARGTKSIQKRKRKGGFFNFFKKGCDKYHISERIADKNGCKKDKNCYYEDRGSQGSFCFKKTVKKGKKSRKKRKRKGGRRTRRR